MPQRIVDTCNLIHNDTLTLGQLIIFHRITLNRVQNDYSHVSLTKEVGTFWFKRVRSKLYNPAYTLILLVTMGHENQTFCLALAVSCLKVDICGYNHKIAE